MLVARQNERSIRGKNNAWRERFKERVEEKIIEMEKSEQSSMIKFERKKNGGKVCVGLTGRLQRKQEIFICIREE
jgi:hypothetical protein